ncbi:transcriptional regulator ATRX homolog isoform X2 [Euwallacea similis]|uniref:transcriptional regulator ATRX homolog isoform X2 n=1 Tax=Euwallacea similis TaxID=1736056 RepID=UPI00344BFF4F
MQMPKENVKDYRTPFEELSDEISLKDPNPSSKSEYKRLKYIEDNILAVLCGHKKCKCCNSVKSIINEVVSFNLLKMTQSDSGFSPQSTDSWKVNFEAPSCSPHSSDLDAYVPPIKVLSNISIHKQGGSNKTSFKGNNKASMIHFKEGQNTTGSASETFLSEARIHKEHEAINEDNKKISVKKRQKRKSRYTIPGSKPNKSKIKESASPLKQTKITNCSSDISAENVYLVTLNRPERFEEKSLNNNNNERESANINDDQQDAESGSYEFPSEVDHISKENEVVKEDKVTMKKRRKRKSHYVVPGSKPRKPKIKEGIFSLKSVKKNTTAEQKDIEDHSVLSVVNENIENLNHKKNMGLKGKKRKSGSKSTEQPTKKQKSNLNESGREVNASSSRLEFYKKETRKSSCKGHKGTGALKHKFVPQKLVFSPESWDEEETDEESNKQKKSKSKRRPEASQHRETLPLEKPLRVEPKRSKPLRHANFLIEGGRDAALTEVFYRSKKPQTTLNASSYIYALIDNKKFKISHDRTKNGTFSKAVLKRLSRKGGCGLTLGASFLERESLRLHPMKNRKSIYSPNRWLTSKLFDDMCLYD